MEMRGKSTKPGSPSGSFAHRVATSELVLLWNCLQPGTGQVRLEGVAQNPWAAQPIRFLEFELVGVDAQERTTAQAAGTARDLQLFTNQTTPFQLDLKTIGTEVRFDLYYRYYFLEFFEGDKEDPRLAGPPMASPRHLAQTNFFMARNVCAEAKAPGTLKSGGAGV
jgi:hypothetical protein